MTTAYTDLEEGWRYDTSRHDGGTIHTIASPTWFNHTPGVMYVVGSHRLGWKMCVRDRQDDVHVELVRVAEVLERLPTKLHELVLKIHQQMIADARSGVDSWRAREARYQRELEEIVPTQLSLEQ